MVPLEIAPLEVKRLLESGSPLKLIDVREVNEYQITRLDGSELIPVITVPARLQQLEGAAEETRLIVICHHGVRSLQVVAWLREQGVANCQSVAGGIDRWSLEVDPRVPRY